MARFKKLTQNKRESKIVYGEGIVDGIVLLAVSELDNVELCSNSANKQMHSKAIKVLLGKGGVTVDVWVKINYNLCVSDMSFKIQEAIRHNVESMTEYHIESVNVHVNGVTFEDAVGPVTEEPITSDN